MRRYTQSRRWTTALMWGVSTLLLLNPAQAAEVKPAWTEVEARPRRTQDIVLSLKPDQANERIKAQVVDYWIDRQGRPTTDPPPNPKYSAKLWSNFKPTSLLLNGTKPTDLKVPFRVPAGTRGGEYYMGIEVGSINPQTLNQGPLRVKLTVSALVLVIVRVPGARHIFKGEVVEESMKIEDFTPNFQATFKNTGTASVITRMGVAIRDTDRKVIDYFLLKAAGSQAEDGQGFLLPESIRDFSARGNRKLPTGKYVAEISAVFGPKNTRVMKTIPFEIEDSPAQKVPPLDDVHVAESPVVIELPPGAITYKVLNLTNRGFNTVEFGIGAKSEHVSFTPTTLKIEPGKTGKVRTRISVPRFEDARRDIDVTLTLTGEGQKGTKVVPIRIYAPGTAPKPKPKPAAETVTEAKADTPPKEGAAPAKATEPAEDDETLAPPKAPGAETN